MQIFGAAYLHSWGSQKYASAKFFVRNLILCNFYLKLLSIQSNFFVVFNPNVNREPNSRFWCITVFQKRQIFRGLYLHSWNRQTCFHGVLCRKFNSAQFSFKAFSDIINIFCTVKIKTDSKNYVLLHSKPFYAIRMSIAFQCAPLATLRIYPYANNM